jgi:small basic protein (TIGR04137 family)
MCQDNADIGTNVILVVSDKSSARYSHIAGLSVTCGLPQAIIDWLCKKSRGPIQIWNFLSFAGKNLALPGKETSLSRFQLEESIMSHHPSFKVGAATGKKRRNVLKRFERITLLQKRGQWKDGDRVTGLVKTKADE